MAYGQGLNVAGIVDFYACMGDRHRQAFVCCFTRNLQDKSVSGLGNVAPCIPHAPTAWGRLSEANSPRMHQLHQVLRCKVLAETPHPE